MREQPEIERSQPEDEVFRLLRRADLTRESLSLLYVRLVEQRYPDCVIEYVGTETLRITWGSSRTSEIFLTNLALECESVALNDRPSVVERYLKVLEGNTRIDECGTIEDIVPIVKDSIYRSYLKDWAPSISDHLVGDLWIVYALDLPDSTDSLTEDRMRSLGVTKEGIRELALDNLRRILPDVERHGDGPWFLLTAGDVYVASILLIDSVWDQCEKLVEGDLIAVAPSRDVVMFTGSKSRDGLLEIRNKANDIVATGDHVISTTMLRRAGGRWIVFE